MLKWVFIRRTFGVLFLVTGILLFSGVLETAAAARRSGPDLFHEGNVRFSLFFGSGTAFGETYRIVGAGAGYYLMDNLELGLDGETWQGNDPRITRLSPQVMYVFPTGTNARPYAGAFYRRTLIEQYRDLNDAGARAGALFLYGRQAYLGTGVVYERHLGCDRFVYDACWDSYLEVLVAVIF
jgi:hypothetical protein